MGKELSLSWRTGFSPGRAKMWIWIFSSRKWKFWLLKEVSWPLNSQEGEQEQGCGVYCLLDILWLCLIRGWGTPYLWSPGRFWPEISAEIPEIPQKPQSPKIEVSTTPGKQKHQTEPGLWFQGFLPESNFLYFGIAVGLYSHQIPSVEFLQFACACCWCFCKPGPDFIRQVEFI